MPRLARLSTCAAVLALLVAAPPPRAMAQPLVADLSSHLIALTTGFAGAELLLFGAIDGDGDVVIVVRGPKENILVRRKERVSGIWINRRQLIFEGAPGFYSITSSRAIEEIAPKTVRARNELGIAAVRLVAEKSPLGADAVGIFRQALIRNKRKDGLYQENTDGIQVLGRRLFRSSVSFPSTTPTGKYSVTIFLIRDGQVVSAQSTPLDVSKTGLEARIFRAAHKYAALYGVFAILMALFAGWLAGALFRRV